MKQMSAFFSLLALSAAVHGQVPRTVSCPGFSTKTYSNVTLEGTSVWGNAYSVKSFRTQLNRYTPMQSTDYIAYVPVNGVKNSGYVPTLWAQNVGATNSERYNDPMYHGMRGVATVMVSALDRYSRYVYVDRQFWGPWTAPTDGSVRYMNALLPPYSISKATAVWFQIDVASTIQPAGFASYSVGNNPICGRITIDKENTGDMGKAT